MHIQVRNEDIRKQGQGGVFIPSPFSIAEIRVCHIGSLIDKSSMDLRRTVPPLPSPAPTTWKEATTETISGTHKPRRGDWEWNGAYILLSGRGPFGLSTRSGATKWSSDVSTSLKPFLFELHANFLFCTIHVISTINLQNDRYVGWTYVVRSERDRKNRN
jgi:hypothetical protein